MAESEDDLKHFKSWPERVNEQHPWLGIFDFATGAADLVYLAVLIAAFGAVGIVYWLFGGAPP